MAINKLDVPVQIKHDKLTHVFFADEFSYAAAIGRVHAIDLPLKSHPVAFGAGAVSDMPDSIIPA